MAHTQSNKFISYKIAQNLSSIQTSTNNTKKLKNYTKTTTQPENKHTHKKKLAKIGSIFLIYKLNITGSDIIITMHPPYILHSELIRLYSLFSLCVYWVVPLFSQMTCMYWCTLAPCLTQCMLKTRKPADKKNNSFPNYLFVDKSVWFAEATRFDFCGTVSLNSNGIQFWSTSS